MTICLSVEPHSETKTWKKMQYSLECIVIENLKKGGIKFAYFWTYGKTHYVFLDIRKDICTVLDIWKDTILDIWKDTMLDIWKDKLLNS